MDDHPSGMRVLSTFKVKSIDSCCFGILQYYWKLEDIVNYLLDICVLNNRIVHLIAFVKLLLQTNDNVA